MTASASPRPIACSTPDGFDPSAARGPTLTLPLDAVIDLLEVSHAPERVREYGEAMRRGALFPPIAVVRVAGRYLVADGHKRLAAYRMLAGAQGAAGEAAIPVELWSWRRWWSDQWRQFTGKMRQHVRVLCGLPFDAGARRDGRRLFWDTVGHWRRIGRSLARRWR